MNKQQIEEMVKREFREMEEKRSLGISAKPEETEAVRVVRMGARYGTEITLAILAVAFVIIAAMGVAGVAIVVTTLVVVVIACALIQQKAVRDLDLDKDNHYVFGSSCKCCKNDHTFGRSSANPLNPRSPWFMEKRR